MFDQIISSISSLIESADGTVESVGDVVETTVDNDWLPTAGIIVGGVAAVGAIAYGAYRLFKSKKVVAKKPFDLDAELAAVSDDTVALVALAAKIIAEGKVDCVKARRAKASAESDFVTANKCLAILSWIEMYERNA